MYDPISLLIVNQGRRPEARHNNKTIVESKFTFYTASIYT